LNKWKTKRFIIKKIIFLKFNYFCHRYIYKDNSNIFFLYKIIHLIDSFTFTYTVNFCLKKLLILIWIHKCDENIVFIQLFAAVRFNNKKMLLSFPGLGYWECIYWIFIFLSRMEIFGFLSNKINTNRDVRK